MLTTKTRTNKPYHKAIFLGHQLHIYWRKKCQRKEFQNSHFSLDAAPSNISNRIFKMKCIQKHGVKLKSQRTLTNIFYFWKSTEFILKVVKMFVFNTLSHWPTKIIDVLNKTCYL